MFYFRVNQDTLRPFGVKKKHFDLFNTPVHIDIDSKVDNEL